MLGSVLAVPKASENATIVKQSLFRPKRETGRTLSQQPQRCDGFVVCFSENGPTPVRFAVTLDQLQIN